MRFLALSAFLATAITFGSPAHAIAQEPEPAPAPAPQPENPRTPPPREYAVPRTQAVPDRVTTSDSPPERANPVRRETAAADQGSRRRPPESSTPPPSPATSAERSDNRSEPQRGERRGAVRRPDSDSRIGRSARDRAVPRTSVPAPDRTRDRVVFYPDYWSYGRYYDPYYSSGFHLGYLAYAPWGWTPAFYGYPYGYGGGYYQPHGYDVGSVKLKVKPNDAEVYVDGYYAGQVDDFDGFWQALKLDLGGHRIEIRKAGFETLQFDVHVQPDRSITYRGEMRPAP